MKKKMERILGSALVFCFCVSTAVDVARATHFRGAIIQYRPVNPSNFSGTIEIRHRIAWRRSFRSHLYCDQSTIVNRYLRGSSSEYLTCRSGCSGTVGNMRYYCTDFSTTEDWSAGERTYRVDLAGVDHFEVSFSGRDWVSLVIGGGGWEVRLKGNLTQRSDTGSINTSPITTVTPILRLQHGCNHTFSIPVEDADGDTVRCRWAISSLRECSGVCNAFPAVLDEVECTLKYEATGRTGLYVVALQIEDFASPSDTIPMSSVPLQFIVSVFTSTEVCTSLPEFVPPTRLDRSCIAVPFNSTYTEPVIALSGGPEVSIHDIVTASPSGLVHSDLYQLMTSQLWGINVTWTPLNSQAGPNLFCFHALDSIGLSSETTCVTLVVGVEAPGIISNTMRPTGEIFPNFTSDWTIEFDKEFIRTPRNRYITVYDSSGGLVERINAASSSNVIYPASSNVRTLRFRPQFMLVENMRYYVLLDPGVAVGREFCNPESPSLLDSTLWAVSIADVTPPRLTFLENPSYSNANVTISWTIDEEATTTCTLQTPSGLQVVNCNYTLSLMNLHEGVHTLYIQTTDLAGNIARTVRHVWTVDLTAPTIRLTSTPASDINQASGRFYFSCLNEWRCTYVCAVYRGSSIPLYRSCSSPYTATSLVSSSTYYFSVRPTDGVGNVGQSRNYSWRIDLTPPVISNVNSVTINCGEDFSPSIIGHPSVTDNEDTNATLTFMDSPHSGCALTRTWTATDRAGNTAQSSQSITFQNPQPPVIMTSNMITIACGNVEEVRSSLARENISVRHPCNRPVNLSFRDSATINRCGFTFTRVWTVLDDCGRSTLFTQTVRVLDQQFPDGPESGLVNAGLYESLTWPQFPGASFYRVFVWVANEPRPIEPVVITSSQTYTPMTSYPPGTRMNWQIEYITGINMTIPSPVWGFQTEPRPDLEVTSVTVPSYAFSGQSFSVSWTVINSGNSSVTTSFTDSVFMGRTQVFSDSRRVRSIRQSRFVDIRDGYTSEAEIDLRNDDIGLFYVYVYTDFYRRVSQDIDRSNNIRISSLPMQVRLTPPPNLNVRNIAAPSSVFSDTMVNVQWTVTNTGLGVTGVDQWYDRLYLSRDNQTDRRDYILRNVHHTGVLGTGSSYTQSERVTMPHAIYGDFFFIVVTDLYNNVYENIFENDNTNFSKVELILSPPPDLVVSMLEANNSLFTGDQLVISYTVTNEGAGPTFETQWTDYISVRPLFSSQRGPAYTFRRYGRVEVSSSYSVQRQLFVLPTYSPGQYNVSIHTDYRNQVFELNADNNNVRWAVINIQERLPELVISSFDFNLEATDQGNRLNVSYTVSNVGAGDTIGAPWRDELSAIHVASQRAEVLLLREVQRTELLAGQQYMYDNSFFLPSHVYGSLHLILKVDDTSQIIERNESNNEQRSSNINIAPLFPDLNATNVRLLSNSQEITGGEVIEIEWTVVNQGELIVSASSWYDSISINSMPRIDSNVIRLADVLVLGSTLEIGKQYQQRKNIILPTILDYSSPYYVIVQADSRNVINENQRMENNAIVLPIEILRPPSPDLQVERATFSYFSSGRLLTVRWTARNVGNSMKTIQSWRDQILLSSSNSLEQSTQDVILGGVDQSMILQADQSYTHQDTYVIPSSVNGDYFLRVVCDISNRITEIDGEENNIYRSANTLFVPPASVARFAVSTNFDSLPTSLYSGQSLTIAYTVTNNGQEAIRSSSWIDDIYLSSVSNPTRSFLSEQGLLIGQRINTMELLEGQSYSIEYNVTIPYDVIGQQYIVILIDMNNRLNILTSGSVDSMISVLQGALPDIRVLNVTSNFTLTSGQPTNVEYVVSNVGEAPATGLWYEAVFLSLDPDIDPFDIRLKTVASPSSVILGSNESYSQSIDIFIPFDLPTSYYYVIVQVNTRNDLFEEDVDNNEAYVLVSITETASTDLAIVNLGVSPRIVTYGDQITYTWSLRNNGSIEARGYKCDSIYLSEDDQWDISDYELRRPVCSSVRVSAFNNNNNNDRQISQQSITPFIAQQNYFGIVRTRSNIRDPNIDNNIGSTSYQIELNAPSIILGKETNLTLVPNDVRVFRIEGVSDEETLIASLFSEQENVYHDLYLRHGSAPTGAIHDAFSQFSLSSFQRAVVRHTRSGDYYIRIESFSNSRIQSSYTITILVKVAQFEILDISPTSAAPLGNVTLKVSGTVLSYYSSAYLVGSTSAMYKASSTYWFSSETLYATFQLSQMETGTYSVRLENDYDKQYAQLNDSFSIRDGIAGQLSVTLERPRALRAGEVGEFFIGIQNIGNTDLLSPHLILTGEDNVLFSLVDDSDPIELSSQIDFLGLPLEGPGGILPPGVATQVKFRIAQETPSPQSAKIFLRILENGSAPHAYTDNKSALKLSGIPDDVWDTIWENFIASVGSTQQSLSERLSEIASDMSLIGKNSYSVDRMVRYQLEVAYGLLSGNQMFSVEDILDVHENSFFPLSIIRTYSAFIHKRRTSGPAGKGWLLNMWEIHVTNITEDTISLWKEREMYKFKRNKETGVFSSNDENIVITSEGIFYSDNNGVLFYMFDPLSGRLANIGGFVHNETLNFYYSSGQLQSIENSKSRRKLNMTYTSNGLILRVQLINSDDSVEKNSLYNYDPSETYLLSVTTDGVSVEYRYNTNGDLIRSIIGVGYSSEIGYNENSFVESIREYANNELTSHYTYGFNWNGILNISVFPQNASTVLQHDRLGNVVSVTNDGGLPKISQEVPYGRRFLLGDEVISENRVEGGTTYSIDQKGIQNKFVNDDEGRLTIFEDGDGYEYTFSYNENGLQTGLGYPDGTSTSFNYDDEGHLATLVNPDQTTISFNYDDEDNLIQRSHSNGETFYEYDSRRALLSAANENGKISITYDNKNRPSEVYYHSTGYRLYYGYSRGNLRSFIADNHGYHISYIYDDQSRLSEVRKSSDGSLVAQFQYQDNLLVKKTLGNGAYAMFLYDDKHRIMELSNYYSNGTLSSTYHYDYDLKGRVTTMTNADNDSWAFRYDLLGQVTGWKSSTGEVIRFTYDNRGNRLSAERNGNMEEYAVNSMNQYTTYNGTDTFIYDQNGNLINKITSTEREVFKYDPEGRLIRTETTNNRCSYHYDAFGNLYTKNCTDGSHQYLIDPFGPFGSDVIGEVNSEGMTYFIHSNTEGLLAALRPNGQLNLYYEYTIDGSVRKVLDQVGRVLNSYEYDIFGKLTFKSEQVRNIFKYGGLLGVLSDEELNDVYMMRARHYDAQHGRFISLDPTGLNGKSTNYYMYVLNNPLILKDPTGLLLPLAVASPIVGAVVGVTVHILTTSDITFGSVIGAAVDGGLVGLTVHGATTKFLLSGFATAAGEYIKYKIQGNFSENTGQYVSDIVFSLVWHKITERFLGPFKEGFDLSVAAAVDYYQGIYKSALKSVHDNILLKYLMRKFEELPDLYEEKLQELRDAAMKLARNTKEALKQIIEWIRSRDPNDMIGPAGYGDAHFISPRTKLDYRIRFENDPNATAPAQRVFIRSGLDEDLDIRSFRVGSFGFGDFVRNVTTSRSILQETINLTLSLGVFVRVRAGLDIIRREASWEFQTLDPLTGEEPIDPSIGFLPPNNITTGQGFVTFSVFVEDSVSDLARIDAEASIIFDANEPIDTPPIFNTIDRSHPEVNLTVNSELLRASVLAVNVDKMDSGSGVKSVDIYRLVEGSGGADKISPVVRGSINDIVILPLNDGTEFRFATSSVDNVGNRRLLTESMQDSVLLNFPIIEIQCPNNCSDRGNCTVFGTCVCQPGRFGSDCGQDLPPPEPPVFETPESVGGEQGLPVYFQISAIIPGRSNLTGLQVYLDNIPEGSTLSRGTQEQDRWVFTTDDFGIVELNLPSEFSGELTVEVTAVAAGASRQKALVISVESVNTSTQSEHPENTTVPTSVTSPETIEIQCPNNCSDRGNCTVFGICVCEPGSYGSDCGQEPPVLETPESVVGEQGEPVYIQISAIIPGQSNLTGLRVYLDNIPEGSTFNRGRQEQDRWVFTADDFGIVELNLPSEFSGELTVEVTAVAAGVSRQKALLISVESRSNSSTQSEHPENATVPTSVTSTETREIQCPNNCSDRGNCTVFGICVCEPGNYGSDCGQEPPVLETPESVGGEQGEPVYIQISAIIPGQSNLTGLRVYVDNIPEGSTFNRGTQEQDRWVFTADDFGVVELNLSSEFSGELTVEVTAVAAGVSTQKALVIFVESGNNTSTQSERPQNTTVPTSVTSPETREGGATTVVVLVVFAAMFAIAVLFFLAVCVSIVVACVCCCSPK